MKKNIILLILSVATCALRVQTKNEIILPEKAQVTTWQAPEGFSSEKYYQVKVNGIKVPVYDTPVASYDVFENTRVEDSGQKLPAGQEEYHRQFRGKISNIVFKDIQVVGGLLPFSIFHGFDKEKNVSDVTIDNLTYMGRKLTTQEEARIRTQNTTNLIIR